MDDLTGLFGPSTWPLVGSHRRLLVVLATLLPLAAAGGLGLVRGSVNTATAVLVLVALVVAIASTGIRSAALLGALAAALGFDMFLTRPYGSLVINRPDDVETAVLLLVISTAVAEVSLWGQRQQSALSRQHGYLEGLSRIAQRLSSGQATTQDTVSALETEIAILLRLDSCRYVPGDSLDPTAPVLHHDGTITRHGAPRTEQDGLPTEYPTLLPVRAAGQARGHFELVAASHVARPTRAQLCIAALLADQLAISAPSKDY